ncbi:chemotaxis protein CheB [Variovorax sp. RHLX14]|uniref:chemotaxis protein CheB n=1 Tax=Variovorax sp. RHLX14 TaxID=1259731 RepID=UPI003F451221
MAATRVIVIGAGGGGVAAMRRILSALPDDFDAAIVLLIHSAPEDPDPLPLLVQREGRLHVSSAVHDTPIASGNVYVVPRGCHALIKAGGVLEVTGPKRLRTARPAVDQLFKSAASVYGPLGIALVLTGQGNDGTEGLRAIGAARGLSLVQSLADSEFPGMPGSALIGDHPSQCLLIQEIAPALVSALNRTQR